MLKVNVNKVYALFECAATFEVALLHGAKLGKDGKCMAWLR